MRIKKLVALLLSVVLMCFVLVGCKEEIGDYLDGYDYKPEVVVDMYYDFYIIVGEGTDDMAKTTVNEKINQIISDKYRTKINIHYITEAEYAATVKSEVENDTRSSVPNGYYYGGKIVLINDYAMVNDYLGAYLADLNPYLATNAYGTLNTQITSTLLSAAQYNFVDKDGNYTDLDESGEAIDRLLAIPNNRVFGEYEYILINRDIAEVELCFSAQTELREITSMDSEAAMQLIDAIPDTYTQEQVIKTAKGPYELKAQIESELDENGDRWICNVAKYPVATAEIAYGSAFGVIPADNVVLNGEVVSDNVARAMDVIYAINTDVSLRNILQYGVENTNFLLEDGYALPITGEGSVYNMNVEYTGDVFKAYYREGVWTETQKLNGQSQNKESIFD